MAESRAIETAAVPRPTIEGAGVRLHRGFGYHEIPAFDPFLMLDDFRANRTEEYLPGFPWHPHRGIETVTYMLEGRIEHGDSMGHSGDVPAGGVQWMTAGSGIIHQEMPKPVNGRMGGFQLWVNLPRKHKMMDPRYQEIRADEIPVFTEDGVQVRVVCGSIAGVSGPVKDIMVDPEYLDVTMVPGTTFSHPVRPGFMAAAYVFQGAGLFDRHGKEELGNRTMIRYGETGDTVDVSAGKNGVRFLESAGSDPPAFFP
ncbi:MAG TPA: pirin family protein [Methanoregula sp.]|nr:pirin family protein [Methanoregula sp.]